MTRLSDLSQVPPELRPRYDPARHGIGIVHLGLGAFHRAHQAALTDLALAFGGGDWRILGVSLRSNRVVEEVAPQNGLYTLIERSSAGNKARVVGAIAGAMCSAGDPGPVLAAMAAPTCRIVSLTVTEKAYGLNRAMRGCDPLDPAIGADLAEPLRPQSVLGLLVRALALRRAAGTPPFTVLCCDNLPENGALVRGAVLDFARHLSPDLADWIAATTAFPCSMVDRITPASTAETLAEAARAIGLEDRAAVETESFCQWVIEDNFPMGRPGWEAAGVIFTEDVAPYEAMKLRMLNGSHSMLAYAGFHAGLPLVRDVMADPALAKLVRRHMSAAAASLSVMPGIDLDAYAGALILRFENPAIAHQTFQIAMDGSVKMPQRIFSAVATAPDLRPFAFATAAWLRHVSGSTHDCAPYALRDPRAAELRAVTAGKDAAGIMAAVAALLPMPEGVQAETLPILTDMLRRPMAAVLCQEAAR